MTVDCYLLFNPIIILLKIFAHRIKALAESLVKPQLIQPYWVKIITRQPSCTYYFGPFNSRAEAKQMRHGYIEDLVEEKAIGISVKIERCSPTRLTITDEQPVV